MQPTRLRSHPTSVREALRLGTRPIVGTFGFLLPHKGTLDLVRAVDGLREELPDVLLLALCARYPNIESREYEEAIRKEVADRGMEDNVLLLTDYLPDEVARTLLSASDAIVLPYRNTGESSSAALRFVLPLGRAIVVTDEPIFADSREAVLPVDPDDPLALEHAIRRVLLDRPVNEEFSRKAARRAQALRWDRVVADHRDIYLAAKRAGTRRRCGRPLVATAR